MKIEALEAKVAHFECSFILLSYSSRKGKKNSEEH